MTTAQRDAISILKQIGSCPAFFCSSDEWKELQAQYICRPSETEERVYEVWVLDAGFELLDCEAKASENGDRYFEETRQHLFTSGKLRL
jgi:hypothetical protein